MMRAPLLLTLLALLALPALAHEPEPEPATRSPVVLAWERAFYGSDEDPLNAPVALASAAPGELVVADVDPPSLRIFREGEGRWVQERKVSLPSAPFALVAQGERYVVSVRESGALHALERRGWGLRQLPLPRGVFAGALAAGGPGSLLVHDQAAHRVLRLADSGQVRESREVNALLRGLVGLPAGFFGVAPARSVALRYGWSDAEPERLPLSGVAPREGWPASMVPAASGGFWLLDRHGGRILLVSETGRLVGTGSRRGWREGLLYYPSALSTLGTGRLAVADQGNGRVQVFRVVVEETAP